MSIDQDNIDILLITPSSVYVQRFREAVAELGSKITLHDTTNVDAALDFINQRDQYADAPQLNMLILDFQTHETDEIEFLSALKNDPKRRQIPIIALTKSEYSEAIQQLYDLHVNACIRPPDGPSGFDDVIQPVVKFWLNIAHLPPK